MHLNQDVMARFGFFDTPGGLWIFDHSKYVLLCLVALLATALVKRSHALFLVSMMVLLIASYIALPLSSLLLGQTIQTYHFLDQLEFSLALVVFVLASVLLQPWLNKISAVGFYIFAALALALAVGVRQAELRRETPVNYYMDFMNTEEGSYRSDFAELATFLNSLDTRNNSLVLGSLDCQVLDWWVSFRKSPIYLGGAFYTITTQGVVDDRFVSFCRLINMPRLRFEQLLQKPWVLARMLGDNYFHAYSQHTQAPIEQYPKDKQYEIQEGWVHDSWNLAMPQDHAERMLSGFDANTGLMGQLDLVVLTHIDLAQGFAPPKSYAPVYENATFRVYFKGYQLPGSSP